MSNLSPRTLPRGGAHNIMAVRRQLSRQRVSVLCLLCLLAIQSLAGCGGASDGSNSASDGSNDSSDGSNDSRDCISGPPELAASHGHFVGTVEIDGVTYYGDAILTPDGVLRLYIGGRAGNTGITEQERPDRSEQFIADVVVDSGEGSGSGVLIGQQCAADNPSRFCGMAVPGEISVGFVPGEPDSLAGEVRVTTTAGQETGLLDLSAWNAYYAGHATEGCVPAEYEEVLAEFASASDVVVSIDDAGRLFFQSASSGCIGNGTVTPHLDGQFNIYDVALTIESCDALHAYLNGEFEGLATPTTSNYWADDFLLRTWLSKSDPASPAAVAMLGRPL